MDIGREDKNPWTKWYWQDWESDIGLQVCSLAAKGLWMDMLSIMARSKKKGFLLDGEKQMQSKILAKKARESIDVVDALLTELKEHEVYSISSDGVIYNRRMVRESELSRIRSEVGHLGGRPKKQNESKEKANTVELVKARSVSASASASAFKNLWSEWPVIGRGKRIPCEKKFHALYKQGKFPDFQKVTQGYFIFLDWQKNENKFEQHAMHLATWLNNWEGEKERYVDEQGNVRKPEKRL